RMFDAVTNGERLRHTQSERRAVAQAADSHSGGMEAAPRNRCCRQQVGSDATCGPPRAEVVWRFACVSLPAAEIHAIERGGGGGRFRPVVADEGTPPRAKCSTCTWTCWSTRWAGS